MLPDNLENRQSLFSIIDSFERKSRYAALDKSKNLSGNTASLQSFWCLSTIEKNVHRELCELF